MKAICEWSGQLLALLCVAGETFFYVLLADKKINPPTLGRPGSATVLTAAIACRYIVDNAMLKPCYCAPHGNYSIKILVRPKSGQAMAWVVVLTMIIIILHAFIT